MSKTCCKIIDEQPCAKPATRHANHDNADWYCDEHGVCGHCGESVEYFVKPSDLEIWICPCVSMARYKMLQLEHLEPKKYVPFEQPVKKETARNHWQD